MKIFLSAVSSQFKRCRDALRSDLAAVGAEVVVQEDFQQHGGALLVKLENYIATCDRIIALIGDAYGCEPEMIASPRRSYTQWEYFFGQGERLQGSRVAPKQVFVYFATPEFLALNSVPMNDDVAALQRQFVEAVRNSGKDWKQFASLNELRALVLRDGFRLEALHPQLRDTKQGTTIRGNQNIVVQIVGDDNQVSIDQPRLNLVRYGEFAVRDTVGLLYAQARSIPLHGRQDEMASLESWANGGAPVSIHVLVGDGGSGKTRLAMELCERLADSDWDAGFLTRRELERFVAEQNLATWGWSRPTLVVVDYAAARAVSLNTWLSELASNPCVSGLPLRMLLLERHADPQKGWWQEAFGRGGAASYVIHGLLDPPEPVRLAPLRPSARREVLNAMLERLGCVNQVPAEGDSVQFDNELETLTWGGAPLYLMMAACRAHETGLHALLALNRTELVMMVAREERARLVKHAQGRKLPGDVVCHMAAVVTLCGGLSWEEVADAVPAELRALRCPNAAEAADIASALQEALPAIDGSVTPILPDAVGEGFILDVLVRNAASWSTVERAWKRSNWRVVDSLIRCAQDFGGSEDQPPLSWLATLTDEVVDVHELWTLEQRLPQSSVALRHIAMRVSQRLVDALQSVESSQDALSTKAGALNNLAIHLSDVGDREGALAPAHEAMSIFRELAAKNPDAFLPDLVMSLHNLANHLSFVGDYEGALEPAKEALTIRRELATKNPDAFRPNLASSLHNLSIRLSELGYRKEALELAREAVTIRRELAKKNSDAFRPDLARSLNNLAKRLSDVRDHSGGLELARESLGIRRALVAKNPDAFRPELASSLHDLANRLIGMGDSEGALAPAREAVAIRRELVEKNPMAFRPELADSLNTLACQHRLDGEYGVALELVQEAVELHRELAATNPDAFLPRLAMSLQNLAIILSGAGEFDRALGAAKTAVEALTPNFTRHPQAFEHWMDTIVKTYLERCEECHVSPENALLEAVQTRLSNNQGEG